MSNAIVFSVCKLSLFLQPTIGPMIAEIMTLKWWTMKFAWLYMNFNIYK